MSAALPTTLSPAIAQAVRESAEARRDAVVAFTRDLVRIPSPSGDEERAVRRTVDELRALGFADAHVDGAGNAIATLATPGGAGRRGAVMLNAHLDHVDAGDHSAWPHAPFSGEVAGGRLHGRGSSDTKSAVAAQCQAAAVVRDVGARLGLERRRDVVVAAVVQEEVGGLGTASLVDSLPAPAFAVIGEPSDGALAFGHRGRVEAEVTFHGRAAHASRPEAGVNPHASMARFVQLLDGIVRDADSRFGRSTVAPTLVRVRPTSPNVIPDALTLTLDWRSVPAESPEVVLGRVESLARQACLPGVTVSVAAPQRPLRSWTGMERAVPRASLAFATDASSPALLHGHAALEGGLGRDVPLVAWTFASDGGWLHAAGATCLGYGPGSIDAMHVCGESVSVDAIVEAVAAYALLVLALDAEEAA